MTKTKNPYIYIEEFYKLTDQEFIHIIIGDFGIIEEIWNLGLDNAISN